MDLNLSSEHEEKKESKEDVVSTALISEEALKIAKTNSAMASSLAAIVATLFIVTTILSYGISKSRNSIAVVPVSEWSYPAIRSMNTPIRFDEEAKPIHVALRYIRGFYEVDIGDFIAKDSKVENISLMLNRRLVDLLAYVEQGSGEHVKIAQKIASSDSLYYKMAACNCSQVFNISDLMIHQPPAPIIRLQFIGKMRMIGDEMPLEELGLKSITIDLIPSQPLYDVGKGGDVKAINKEGWYVVASEIEDISSEDLEVLRKIRNDRSMRSSL